MLRRFALARNRAFTLIELLVVILIIGILIAVAAPSFLGQTSKAEDSVAQQNLYNVYISGKSAAWESHEAYPYVGDPSVNPGDPEDTTGSSLFGILNSSEPEFKFSTSVSATNVNQIAVEEINPEAVYYEDEAASGHVFCLLDVEAGNYGNDGVPSGVVHLSGPDVATGCDHTIVWVPGPPPCVSGLNNAACGDTTVTPTTPPTAEPPVSTPPTVCGDDQYVDTNNGNCYEWIGTLFSSWVGVIGDGPDISDLILNEHNTGEATVPGGDVRFSADINDFGKAGTYSYQWSTTPDFTDATTTTVPASAPTLDTHNGELDYHTDIAFSSLDGTGKTYYWRASAGAAPFTSTPFTSTSPTASFYLNTDESISDISNYGSDDGGDTLASNGGNGGSGGGSGAGGLEVLWNQNDSSIDTANVDGSNQTTLAASGAYGHGSSYSSGGKPVTTDQVGDVYLTDSTDTNVLESIGGATPTTIVSNACPDSLDGSGSDYEISSMAFTPDGSQGAWVCQDDAGKGAYPGGPHLNGYIMYWNGTDATNIYTGQGVMFDNKHGESGGTEYTDQFVAIAPDGSKVVYEGVDETTGQYATDIATAEGGTYVYNIKLEAFSTSGVTAPGAGTLLDSSANASRYVSGGIDGFNNSPLAFVDNGADVVYIVNSTPSPASGNDYATYEVAVDGSGSPSQLVDNVLVSGADDTGGNGFLCEEGYGSNTYALCDSSGDYTTTAFTLPSSTIMVAYSAQGGTVPTTPAPTPDINTFVGDGTIHPAYDGEVASTAGVGCPEHVISDSQGNIYLDDGCNTLVYEIPAVSGTYFGQSMSAGDVYVVAGDGSSGVYGYAGAGGPALYANFSGPQGLAVDAQGNLYLADAGNGYNYIDEVPNVSGTYFGQSMIAGDIYAIAGDGVLYGGYNGDGGPALSAGLGNGGIESLAVDAAGNVYATEPGDNVVREIAAANGPQFGQSMTTGDIYTVVGDGSSGHSGDGGPSTNAELSNPAEVAVDADGNLYISDVNNNVIREVYSGNGSQRGQSMTANDIYTVAGVEGSSCSGVGSGSGDGAAATSATFDCPKSVAVDANGDLFIGDIYGEVVREVPVASGSYFAQNMSANDIYTIAGDGTYGYSGDGGPALNAELIDPKVAVDPSGNLYIVDNTRVREVQP